MTPASTPERSVRERLAPECLALPIEEICGGARRLDAEVYLTPGFLVRQDIAHASLQVTTLGELASIWQPSRLTGVTVAPEHGEPFLTATQVFDIWPRPRKWLAASRTPKIETRYVEPGWILVTCSGTVGSSIVTYSAHAGLVISHDILRVQPRDARLRGYIYAFLRTRFGLAMMRSSRYGNIIKHLEVEHLDDLPIPILDNLIDDTDADIGRTFEMRDEAHKLDRFACERFGQEVGAPEPPSEEGFSVSSSELFEYSRRLDAYTYNPQAESALAALGQSGYETQPLRSLTEAVFGVPRFKHVYLDRGIPYLDSEPLFKINPELRKFIPPRAKSNAERYFVKSGWLMMACSGQIYGLNGGVVLATEQHENAIISNYVVRIIPNGVRPGYLSAVLNHPGLGQPLLLRWAFGTEVPEIAPEDVALFPVLRLPDEVESEIANAAERASELRMKADEKENGAVARLEEALDAELEKSKGKKKHGPLHIPLDFDEAMKRAVQVPAPDEAEG